MTISVIQAQGTNANSTTAVSLAFSSNVSTGSLICVAGQKFTPSADPFVLGDCTKTAGTATISAFTLDEATANAFDGRAAAAQWSAIVTSGGSLTIQVGGGVAGCFMLIGLVEAGGSWDSTRVDATNHNQADPGTVGATATAGSATSVGAALFVSGVQVNGSAAATTSIDGSATLVYKNETGTDDNGATIYRIVGTSTAYNPTYTLGGTTISAWAATNVAYKEAAGGGTDQPTSQIWWDVGGEATDAPDHSDASVFDWYADNTANRANVVPPIAPYLPDSYEWEDPDRWNDAVWLWPLSQAPPIPDFVPDYIRPQDGSDQLEDFDEDFAFAAAPLSADVVVSLSTPGPQLPDLPEEPDEDFGFKDDPLPDDILDQLNNTFSGYFGEPDEIEWFTFIQDPSDTDAFVDIIYPDLWDDWQEELEENFGFTLNIPDDDPVVDQAPSEDARQLEDADEDFGFADQPLADDNDVGIRAEFPDQAEEPEDEPFAFSADPLPDDVQSDQVFTEDATEQPPDPEDEDFGQSFDPIAPDLVIESDQVFVEDARNQEGELPPDEDFGFSADPTPDDAIPVPLTIVDTHDGVKKRRKREEERKRREELRRETIANLVSPKPADIEILETAAPENAAQAYQTEAISGILAQGAETPDDDEDDIEVILLLLRL